MPWGELAQVTATYFAAGENPWLNSEAPADFLREALPGWWEPGYLWWTLDQDPVDSAVDDNHRLVAPVVRFAFDFPWTGRVNADGDPPGLLRWEVERDGVDTVFADFRDGLKQIADAVRQGHEAREVGFLTLWQCDAGRDADTWLGPGEFWSVWELYGYLMPLVNDVRVIRIDN